MPDGPLPAPDQAVVAYFSMEAAVDPRLPTYSGGLGVLAGDFLRSAADLGLPLVAVTLRYREGYFRQLIDARGRQVEEPVAWEPGELLEPLEARVEVEIGGRRVLVGAWRLVVPGLSGAQVPVLFLDTDVPGNAAEDRRITDQLYGGDVRHRLSQEAVLGIGGVSMLRALGYDGVTTYHLNEGHASLLGVRLLELEMGDEGAGGPATAAAVEAVRARCVFTTHTPVPAGHDRFAAGLVREVLGSPRAELLASLGLLDGGELNMTTLGARLSGYVNAVSRRHRRVAKAMMPEVEVASITNGVHHVRWASPAFRAVFDEHLPGWRADSSVLRYASDLPLEALASAHAASKEALLRVVARRAGVHLAPEALTIGLARRIAPYKRTTLILSEPERLAAIAERHGPLQLVCSGKAHPRDTGGKEAVAALVAAARRSGTSVKIVFLEDYGLELAAVLCAGADLWLNTPLRPLEASGTSGMKAAVNGVPSLSILDGWWLEGWIEGVTGWAIGEAATGAGGVGVAPGGETSSDLAQPESEEEASRRDATALYDKLGEVVAPLYYGEGEGFLRLRRGAIALNGSFFTADRMAREYAMEAYRLPGR